MSRHATLEAWLFDPSEPPAPPRAKHRGRVRPLRCFTPPPRWLTLAIFAPMAGR